MGAPVVAGENDERVPADSKLVDLINDLANRGIDGINHAGIDGIEVFTLLFWQGFEFIFVASSDFLSQSVRGADIEMSQVKEELTIMIVFDEDESPVSEFLGHIDVAIVVFINTVLSIRSAEVKSLVIRAEAPFPNSC